MIAVKKADWLGGYLVKNTTDIRIDVIFYDIMFHASPVEWILAKYPPN